MQDEVNQDYSEQNEVDGMKKGADLPHISLICNLAYYQGWMLHIAWQVVKSFGLIDKS